LWVQLGGREGRKRKVKRISGTENEGSIGNSYEGWGMGKHRMELRRGGEPRRISWGVEKRGRLDYGYGRKAFGVEPDVRKGHLYQKACGGSGAYQRRLTWISPLGVQKVLSPCQRFFKPVSLSTQRECKSQAMIPR